MILSFLFMVDLGSAGNLFDFAQRPGRLESNLPVGLVRFSGLPIHYVFQERL